MVVVLSPWADAPPPSSSFIAVMEGEALATAEPEVEEEISSLLVEVAMDEGEFAALSALNEDFAFRHPDIEVELRRIAPEEAHEIYRQAAELEEAADIMLFENEWVKAFAAAGYLLPSDAAFAGKSLAEQFEALSGPLKWNGFLWGVPKDMDPLVLVWNTELLSAWLGEGVALPLTVEQWTAAAKAGAEAGGAQSWLAMDGHDPLALLAWMESATGERSDDWWTRGSSVWSGTVQEQALALLVQQLAGVAFTDDDRQAIQAVRAGDVLAAIVPNSEAAALERELNAEGSSALEIDHRSWRLPFTWPRGRSYVISSRTASEEAASVWIAEMTAEQAQLQQMEQRDLLPVYRSFYDGDRQLSNLIPGRANQAFPSLSPELSGPEASERLRQLGELWSGLSEGRLTLDAWKAQWGEAFAD
ncbi:extracellular solute-binding protein [Cohnella boryungensis]|uniref:Extracellular solute-binding protein n=2 Tax=Cohnella boryungensis TaxID=768479 RepID=A0ABV8SDG7_9BACL